MLRARLRRSVLVRLLGSACVACAPLFFSLPSFAEERGFALTWQGPTECAERPRTLAAVERLLGAPPAELAAPALAALASVRSSSPGEWRVTLVITREGTSRTRELSGHSCPELADAVALILALAIDPEVFTRSAGEASSTSDGNSGQEPAKSAATAQVPAAKPAGPAQSSARSTPPPTPKQPATAKDAREQRFLGFLALGPSAALGVIPTPAFGVSLTGGLASPALRLSVTGSYFPQRRATSTDHPELSALLDLRTLSVWACWMHGPARPFRAGACGVSEWGAIGARGDGATHVHSETQPWAATGLGGVAQLGLDRDFDLELEAGLLLPWGRPKFLVADAQVFQPSAAVGSARLLLEVHFK